MNTKERNRGLIGFIVLIALPSVVIAILTIVNIESSKNYVLEECPNILTNIYGFQANNYNGEILDDTYYKIWLEGDFYLGEFNASNLEYINLSDLNLTDLNKTLQVNQCYEFEAVVSLRNKTKGDLFYYDTKIKFKTGYDNTIFLTPELESVNKLDRFIFKIRDEDGVVIEDISNITIGMYDIDTYYFKLEDIPERYNEIYCLYNYYDLYIRPRDKELNLDYKKIRDIREYFNIDNYREYDIFAEKLYFTEKLNYLNGELSIRTSEFGNTSNIYCFISDNDYEGLELNNFNKDGNDIGLQNIKFNIKVNKRKWKKKVN